MVRCTHKEPQASGMSFMSLSRFLSASLRLRRAAVSLQKGAESEHS